MALVAVALLATFACAEEATAADSGTSECSTPGECTNPEAEVIADVPPKPEDPLCPSRDLIVRCTAKTLDLNGDKKIDRSELEGAINRLPWYAKG